MTEEMISVRHYFRCQVCLGAFVIKEEDIPGRPEDCNGKCICGGDIEYLGRTHGTHYDNEVKKAPCDKRCTHASGPKCHCECNCSNHGTGRLVTVTVDGGLLRITTFDDELIKRAADWVKVSADLAHEFAYIWGNAIVAANKYECSREQMMTVRKQEERLNRIFRLQVYSTRKKRAQAFLDELKAMEPVAVEAN